MSRLRSNKICFTLNNYTDCDIVAFEEYFSKTTIKYAVVGQEIGENGTPHLQGYIHLDAKAKECGLKFWKKEIPGGERAHFEAARGTDKQNAEYCRKDGPYIEAGTASKSVDSHYTAIYEAAKISLDTAMEIDAEYTLKHFTQLKAVYDHFDKAPSRPDRAIKGELRPWQREVLQLLKAQDDRRILFVVDPKGNAGKTTMSYHLMSTEKAFSTGGKQIEPGLTARRRLRRPRRRCAR